jgi:tetratricopeptide (TPR) repeat protein
MVKNGGPQFERMLINNLDIIDRWTILDTGSTDQTIEIINRVLVGKKEGNLYQEPFINFRESRNRLLDLAGTSCKYNIMLDDTYVVKGNLREFLTEIRSDQYSNSFTLYIKSDDTIYGSNRIIRSDSGLRYIHKIHEVITDKNNINVVIPEDRAFIIDERFDYMEKRTYDRKQLDLMLLYEEIEENPNDPRAYYYLAQTYNLLEDYENALKSCDEALKINPQYSDARNEKNNILNGFYLQISTLITKKQYEEAIKDCDIIIKSDGVVAEVNSLIFNNILGKNLLEVIENKIKESNMYF